MDFVAFLIQNPLAVAATGWVALQGWRLRHEILSKTREEKQAETQDLHKELTLFFGNGGGKLLRGIVKEENEVVLARFEKHEVSEPERFRTIVRDELDRFVPSPRRNKRQGK